MKYVLFRSYLNSCIAFVPIDLHTNLLKYH